MTLSLEAQALVTHGKNAVPRWFLENSPAQEWLYAFAQILDAARVIGDEWRISTYINSATDAALSQHAIDRGTFRQAGETDTALRQRLTTTVDVVTEPALTAGVNAILWAAGQHAFLRVSSFSTSGWNSVLQADSLNELPTLQTIDDGTHPPTLSEDLSNSSAVMHFSSGVTTQSDIEALIGSSSVLFTVTSAATNGGDFLTSGDVFSGTFCMARFVTLRRDRAFFQLPGSTAAFLSRGYRVTNATLPMVFVCILPFGTTPAIAAGVAEYLRLNGAGGFIFLVERRLSP